MHIFQILLLCFFPLIILFANIKGYIYNCLNAYDAGIFHQYLNMIAYYLPSFQGFFENIAMRNASIFTDHFEPILLIAVPFIKLTEYHWSTLVIIEFLFYISFVYFIYKNSKKELFILHLALFIFCKGLMISLDRPIHPNLWSLPFWGLFCYYVVEKKYFQQIMVLTLITTCRESYPFSLVGLSGYYLLTKRWRYFFLSFSIGVGLLYFIFVLRAKIFGATHDYGGWVIHGLLHDPVGLIITSLKKFDYLGFIKLFGPLAPCLYFMDKKSVPILFALAPIFLLHIIVGGFSFHYCVPFVGCLLYLIILNQLSIPLKLIRICVILSIISSLGTYTKSFDLVFRNKSNKCEISDAKKESTEKLVKLYKTHTKPFDSTFATGGIIPQLTKPEYNLYHSGTHAKNLPFYDHILLEKNGTGDTWPKNKDEIEKIYQNCCQQAVNIHLDDRYYFFASGKFTCFQ